MNYKSESKLNSQILLSEESYDEKLDDLGDQKIYQQFIIEVKSIRT
jgi:hypothetical protein